MTPVLVHADRRLVRADARSRRHVRVEITAPEAPPREGRVPVNLAFVVDRSGSMAGDKIEKARKAAIQGIGALRPGDRFAVVAYDDVVEVVVPSTEATPASRAEAERRIAAIDERGSTDLCGGWTAGCDEIARDLGADAVGRCLLLTDGLANHGVTDAGLLAARAGDLRRRRIATSALGIGADFDEALLAAMAEAGGGNFHFVEGASQIPGLLAAEVGEALAVTARDVTLVVEAGPGIGVRSLNGFPCTRAGEAWRVEIGSLFGGQVIDPVLRLTFPPGEAGAAREVRLRLEDRDGALGAPSFALSFEWADHAANHAQERDRVVDRAAARLYAAQAGRDALAHNREGNYGAAREVLEKCLRRVERYAGADPELRAVCQELRERIRVCGHRLDGLTSKRRHYAEMMAIKSRPSRRDGFAQ